MGRPRGRARRILQLRERACPCLPRRTPGCGGLNTNIRFRFAGNGWTVDRQRELLLGLQDIERARNTYGQVALTHTNVANSSIPVIVDFSGGTSGVDCSAGTISQIRISSQRQTGNGSPTLGSSFRGSVVHAFLHAHGLSHVGVREPMDGNIASLSGCSLGPNAHQDFAVLSRDEIAQVMFHFDAVFGGRRNGSANASFEMGAESWTTVNGSLATVSGSGAVAGNTRGRITPANTDTAYVYTETRTWPSVTVTVGANVRKVVASTGNVGIRLYSRDIKFGTMGCDGVFYGSGNVDVISFPNGSAYVYRAAASCPATTTGWNPCSPITAVSFTRPQDVRVRVDTNLRHSSGTPAQLDIDHVRVALNAP